MSTHNFGSRLCARNPDGAIIDAASDERSTLAEIPAVAHQLRAAGVTPGTFLPLYCQLSVETAKAYIASLYAGAVPVPIHERDWDQRIASICRQTDARFVWLPAEIRAERVPPGLAVTTIHGTHDTGVDGPPVDRGADDLALLNPTSGSTGEPRLVEITHGNLVANTEAIVASQGLTDADRAMLILPISYCYGASVLHSHLWCGGSVVLDRRFMFPRKVTESLVMLECTTFAGVVTSYRRLVASALVAGLDGTSLRRFLHAGGALDHPTLRQMREAAPGVDCYVMYGQTEATARITTLAPGDLEDQLGSVGPVLDSLEVVAVDAAGARLPVGEVGELIVRGPSVARRYWNAPVATAQKFRDGWLYTGDLGRIDAAGYITIEGRKQAFVKMRGVRVSVDEAEGIALGVSGVQDAAAVGVPHQEGGEALSFFVVCAAAARPQIEAQLRHAMPGHWVIDRVTVMDALPRIASSKVDRKALASAARAADVGPGETVEGGR